MHKLQQGQNDGVDGLSCIFIAVAIRASAAATECAAHGRGEEECNDRISAPCGLADSCVFLELVSTSRKVFVVIPQERQLFHVVKIVHYNQFAF